MEASGGGYCLAGQRLKLPADFVPGGPRLLMLRPERLRILDGAAPDQLNVLHGTVQDVVYQGDTVLVQVLLAAGAAVAVRAASTSGAMAAIPQRGAPVRLGLAPDDTALLADDGFAP